jgi:DNA-binding PadR family transcriptional regulator
MIERSSREMDATRYIGMYRFLGRAQIEEFVLGESRLSAHSREVAIWRILRRLRERQLITTNAALAGDPEGMPTRIAYFLTARGRRILSALEPGLPPRRPRVEGTFLLAHALMVAEIALVFLRQARAHPDRDVLTWECDWQVASCASFTSLTPRGGCPVSAARAPPVRPATRAPQELFAPAA